MELQQPLIRVVRQPTMPQTMWAGAVQVPHQILLSNLASGDLLIMVKI